MVNAFRLQIWLSFWVYIYLLNFNQKFNFQAKILLSFLCVLGQRFLDVYYLIFAIAPSNIFVTTHILRWLNHKISECFHWSCFFPKLKFVYETDNNTEIRQNPKIIIMFSPAGSIPDDEKFKSFSQFWSFKSFAKQHKKHRLPKGPDTPSKKRGAGFAKVMSRETIPKCCLYGIFTQIWLKCMVNVSKHYSIHGSYWNRKFPTGETHTSTPPSTWRNRQLFHPSWGPQTSPNWLMIVKHLYDALEKTRRKSSHGIPMPWGGLELYQLLIGIIYKSKKEVLHSYTTLFL